jgi:hypothetical protein
MSTASTLTSLLPGATALGLISLCTFPSLSTFTAKRDGWPKVYEDEDGVATEEGTATFSVKLPKILIGTLTFLGLLVSTAIAILETLGLAKDGFLIENWLNAASWVGRSAVYDMIRFR